MSIYENIECPLCIPLNSFLLEQIGKSPLHLAAQKGDARMIEILAANGYALDVSVCNLHTPISFHNNPDSSNHYCI